jgi:hypothetical protein
MEPEFKVNIDERTLDTSPLIPTPHDSKHSVVLV